MNKDKDDNKIDKNFFKAMNYEIAGEIGAIDNEDMISNKKLESIDDKSSRSIVNRSESDLPIRTDSYHKQPRG